MISRERIFPLAIVLLVLIAIGVIGLLGGWNGILHEPAEPPVAVSVKADSVDPLNDDRLVSVQGNLEFERPAMDDELGVSDRAAVVLLRRVEMYQWRESCIASTCTQSTGWSSEPVDSTRFKEQLGHVNPDHFPFASRSFFAQGVRLGAFAPEVELVTAEIPMLAKTVSVAELPANLAASISELDGWLFVGNNALDPVAGDLRMRYQMIASGTATLTGRQAGNRLLVAATD